MKHNIFVEILLPKQIKNNLKNELFFLSLKLKHDYIQIFRRYKQSSLFQERKKIFINLYFYIIIFLNSLNTETWSE